MSDYDKAMMDCFNRAYASAIVRFGTSDYAMMYAQNAVDHFKTMFHRPDMRKGDY